MTKPKKFEKGDLLNLHSSGILSEDQLQAFLYAGWYYLLRYARDRRGGRSEIDHKTGLPTSANDLQPTHRAIRGRDLALSTILPPKSFILSILRTDEIEENAGLAGDSSDREWRCLAMVPPDQWSEDTLDAVSTNTRRFRVLLSKLEAQGQVDTRPQVDDTGQVLGTKQLEHGDLGSMGYRPTNKGLDEAEDFVRNHPFFARILRLEEWLGGSMARNVPAWKLAAEKDEVSA